MSVERGAQNTKEVRAGLRTILGPLHVYGGEGEREVPPADSPEDDLQDSPEQGEDDADDSVETEVSEDKPNKADSDKSVEDQLDEERRARMKLERQIAKDKIAKEQLEADKDAVKDRDKFKTKLEARDKFLTENLLIMEINKQSKFDFIDVDDVIRAFKNDEVHIDLDADEPSVQGLDLALKRIAKDKPHFLKKPKEEASSENSSSPSGSKVGNGKPVSAEAEAKRLGEKFKIPGYGTQAVRPL